MIRSRRRKLAGRQYENAISIRFKSNYESHLSTKSQNLSTRLRDGYQNLNVRRKCTPQSLLDKRKFTKLYFLHIR